MSIELIRPEPEHVPELARICFEAFKGISDAHHFPYDIPSVEVAGMLVGAIMARPDFYGVVAVETSGAGRPEILGFNFVQTSDAVGGVGPLCVDPRRQSRGVGKLLMRHINDWSLKNHGPMMRLMQDTFNTTSLSLYTSLGYTVQEPVVLMSVAPAAAADATVRPLTGGDLDAAGALCEAIYKVSRRNELAGMIAGGPQMGSVPQGRFVGGTMVAHLIPGFFGYCVARTNGDFLDMVQQAARTSPPPLHKVFVPARNGELFRGALGRGFKTIKMMSLMTMGPYESPTGAWAPSVTY